MSKTTKKQFDYFKNRCHYWAKELGCREWRLDVSMSEEDDAEYIACFNTYPEDRVISIALNKDGDGLNNKILDKTAFHEVFEACVLNNLSTIMGNAGFHNDKISEIRHSILRRMENFIFENNK